MSEREPKLIKSILTQAQVYPSTISEPTVKQIVKDFLVGVSLIKCSGYSAIQSQRFTINLNNVMSFEKPIICINIVKVQRTIQWPSYKRLRSKYNSTQTLDLNRKIQKNVGLSENIDICAISKQHSLKFFSLLYILCQCNVSPVQ